GALKTINELKNLLLGILAKAASAIMKIIKDPIGFLGNLVKAVGAGLQLFVTNIATHLKTGVVSWLLGTAVKAGLELPQKFDLKGIIQLIASLLGLTWDNIRARITRKGIPDQAMTAVETSVPVAKKLATEGPAGAVKEIETEAGDIKATILEKLTSYLIPTVLIAGITWIISLLNPASAFVRAVKGIIDIVTFIVNQGAQIVEFVNAVLDAVIAIANGGSAGVPKMVEAALAASVPLLIGFLASLLGIGSLANKVKSVFHAVSRPVNRAIDKIVNFIAKKGKALWNKLRGNDKRGDKKKEDEGKETERSLDVKKEAKDQLAKQTTKPLPTKYALDTIVTKTLDTLRPRGLKQLHTESSGGDPEKFSVIAKASPPTPVAQATVELTSKDYKLILRKAIPGAADIVPFLKKLAKNGHEMVEYEGSKIKVDMDFFKKAWDKKPYSQARGFIKKRFRDATPGHHEWIPSDYILIVLDRAQNAESVVAGEKWIDDHNDLRSDTSLLVFHNLTEAPPRVGEETIGGTRKKFSIPTGHVGAVYYKGDQQTKYESKFHNAARNVFNNASDISGVASNLKTVAERWIWDGNRSYPHDVHPECLDKNGEQITATRQQGNYAQIIDKIDTLIE
ncbi:phage tail protein, partial [Streptomyces atratus]